jgi:polyhydroxyalkanoate synthase
MTLLTTLIDFATPAFWTSSSTKTWCAFREMQMGKGGLMKGQDMASTFSFLRPNDLVWNYVVGNYLKGETPPPFDLLYWNSDCTNLPGPFYAWYLRNLYLENNLIKPGVLTVCGEKIDLSQLKMPVYIYGSREDHIVPVARPMPPRRCWAASAFRDGRLRPYRRRHQPAGQEQAQPLAA